MTGIVANLLLNILIVGLLSATIAYCWLLNRRIKVLQDSKSELAQLLAHFDESTQRASESIIALQSASKRIGENIQHRVEKANYMVDDLTFMIERGSKLTNQLEAGFAVNRARTRVMSEDPPAINKKPEEPVLADSDLGLNRSTENETTTKEGKVTSLEAVLDRVVGRGKVTSAEAEKQVAKSQAAKNNTIVRGRSKAEQELLEMIKVGIKG